MSDGGKNCRQYQVWLEPKHFKFLKYMAWKYLADRGHMSTAIRICIEIMAKHVVGYDLEKGEPAPVVPFVPVVHREG
jgi:hypothetical protein